MHKQASCVWPIPPSSACEAGQALVPLKRNMLAHGPHLNSENGTHKWLGAWMSERHERLSADHEQSKYICSYCICTTVYMYTTCLIMIHIYNNICYTCIIIKVIQYCNCCGSLFGSIPHAVHACCPGLARADHIPWVYA